MSPSPARISDFHQRISWCEIEQSAEFFIPLLQCCAKEDLNPQPEHPAWKNDLTSSACGLQGEGSAKLIAREPFVLCGIKLPELLMPIFSCDEVNFHEIFSDGHHCQKGNVIGTIEGSIRQILAIERTILNLIQRLSGVATKTAEFVKMLGQENVSLLDTRKTTPGLRILEKFATACGGAFNHRMGLFDRVLIKDNHLSAAGVKDGQSLVIFLKKVKERTQDKLVQVEIDELAQLEAAINGKVDAVLLDNFSPQEVAEAVQINNNRVVLEASGGINDKNILDYAKARPHFISTGAPVHSAKWIDIGLDWNN